MMLCLKKKFNILIPENLINFVPSENEIFISFQNKGSQRIIFYGVPLKQEEIEHISKFKAFCSEKQIQFPSW